MKVLLRRSQALGRLRRGKKKGRKHNFERTMSKSQRETEGYILLCPLGQSPISTLPRTIWVNSGPTPKSAILNNGEPGKDGLAHLLSRSTIQTSVEPRSCHQDACSARQSCDCRAKMAIHLSVEPESHCCLPKRVSSNTTEMPCKVDSIGMSMEST